MTGILFLDSLDDTMLSCVKSSKSGQFAGLGVQFRHRYMADSPAACFIAHERSSARIKLIEGDTGNADTGWIIGARHIQGLYKSVSSKLYRDSFIYKLFIGCPEDPAEINFDTALEFIEKIYNSTDGAKQICYLVGFQHQGHDTGYPDVFTVNEAAGGYEKLLKLMEEGRKLNTNVSFHDNYDDAYMDSPAWDPLDISVDMSGGLLKGGVWNGKQAYWISMPVYSKEKAPQRIKRTLGKYPIKDTYHLDVLTASVFRVDYRRESPTGKDADRMGRIAIVEEFRKHGIDITSYPMLIISFIVDLILSTSWTSLCSIITEDSSLSELRSSQYINTKLTQRGMDIKTI